MPPNSTRCRWGWTVAARTVLAVLAAVGAGGLVCVAPSDRRPGNPLPHLTVDLNTAPPGVLSALPKLGPALVGKIVAAREAKRFRSVDELHGRVRGIGPATLAALRPHLFVKIDKGDMAVVAPSPRVAQNTR
jgi:hypothetical protein